MTDYASFHEVFTFDQLSPSGVAYPLAYQPLEELLENFDELIRRLLEVQSGGQQRSPKLIAEMSD